MTELTPLALKLRTAYRYSATTDRDDTGAWWNAVAKVAEAELASVAESATVRPVRLPTVEEAHQAIADRYALEGYSTSDYWDWCASAVLDLAASLNPTWVPVPADATIPAGTLVRRVSGDNTRVTEWTLCDDLIPAMNPCPPPVFAWYVPSGAVLEFPLNQRIEAAARAIHDADQPDEEDWELEDADIRNTYVRLAKAAAEALGVTL